MLISQQATIPAAPLAATSSPAELSLFCPDCRDVRPFISPALPDLDALERACLVCGAAVVIAAPVAGIAAGRRGLRQVA